MSKDERKKYSAWIKVYMLYGTNITNFYFGSSPFWTEYVKNGIDWVDMNTLGYVSSNSEFTQKFLDEVVNMED